MKECDNSKIHTSSSFTLSIVRKIAKAPIRLAMSLSLSLSPFISPSTRNNSTLTGRTFFKFDIWMLYETFWAIQVLLKPDKNNNNSRYCACSRPTDIYDHISLSYS
jgi:hypothetical protein